MAGSLFFYLLLFVLSVTSQNIKVSSLRSPNVTVYDPGPNYHEISTYARDNVAICKSRPFATTQLNYLRSGSDEWLKQYTLENKDREYYRTHGLASTIAYDFLGDTNFKCAIGVQHSCAAQCLDIVAHIPDLNLARRVYFVLTSAGHFVSAVEMIHDSMQAAQSNVGLMAGRMSYTFYWIQPSTEEIARQAAFNQLMGISLWAAQSALNSLLPMIPWTSMKDWVLAEMSKRMGRPISSEPAAVNQFTSPTDNEIPEVQLMQYGINKGYLDDAPFGMRVPPRFGGDLRWNPDGVSLVNWWNNNGKVDGRLWKQEFYRNWRQNQMQVYNTTQPGEEDDIMYKYGWFPDFRARWNVLGFKGAATHAWEDFKDLCAGSVYGWKKFVHNWFPSKDAQEIQDKYFDGYGMVDGHMVTRKIWKEGQDEVRGWMARVAAGEDIPQDERRQQPNSKGGLEQGRISYITYLRTKNQIDPPTKLQEGERLTSWGPQTERDVLGRYEGWDSYDQYHLEQIAKTWPIPDEPETIFVKGESSTERLPNITSHIERITERAGMVTRVLFPILSQSIMKSAVMRMFSTWSGNDKPREWNEMGMQFYIQESTRMSRMALKETVNRVMRSSEVKEDGSTELADLLALGSYLPAHEGVLRSWTAPDVENTLTKNIFYKTLNMALNSQKVFISCTSDFQRTKGVFKNPFILPNPRKSMEPVDECTDDNTGPQNRKSCIGNLAVCYMYRWNDRGIIASHTVEDPFGFDELANEPWNLRASDVVTSSFYSHMMNLRDVQLASNLSVLNSGPTETQAADPTIPGLFTVPICLSKYNWNTQTNKEGFLNDIDPYNSRKALPCYCGDLGADTVKVWHAMGITGTAATQQYAKKLCPAQINVKIVDWLERYVAYCQLGIRIGRIMQTIKLGCDGLCPLVLNELNSKHLSSTLDLEPEHQKAFRCKIEGSKSKECKPYYGSPMSSVWDETIDAIRERKTKELEETKNVQNLGEHKKNSEKYEKEGQNGREEYQEREEYEEED